MGYFAEGLLTIGVLVLLIKAIIWHDELERYRKADDGPRSILTTKWFEMQARWDEDERDGRPH